ncbi:MAG: ATP-dependent Clp protease adaptor ClpS [Chloroflexi bacterium]|nr:ATP-dependent Clp protease adaptor ClpS [Chloroflexota bacterium]
MTTNTSTTIETERVTEPVQRTLEEILPPYSVILHNDEHHSMEYVVESLVKSVPSLSTAEAATIMLEAHQNGQAVVITCRLEQAELYRDRIRSFGLGVTIEKA